MIFLALCVCVCVCVCACVCVCERARVCAIRCVMLMSWDMKKEPIPPAVGDKMTERQVHSKSFSVQLAVRCEWEGGFQSNGNGLISLESTQTKMTVLGWGV
jgi:hypothetical protein